MTKQELYHLLRQPEDITRAHIPVLERLLEAYPYASSFVFLYLYALARSEDIRYEVELKRLAAYLPSRERLFRLVYGYPEGARREVDQGAEVAGFDLIDSFLEGARRAGEDLGEDLPYEAGEGGDYFAGLETKATEPKGAELDTLLPTESRTPQTSLPAQRGEEEGSEGLITETLAKIYIQQGKYERALRILEDLHLHYPEKNRYFADQIRFLQRLVHNNKENKASKI
ncbi:MAG: hypothetical protein SOW66_08260 [Porphyromonas sp.]|nr:hypothetical protein [Porphyromonas sp.]